MWHYDLRVFNVFLDFVNLTVICLICRNEGIKSLAGLVKSSIGVLSVVCLRSHGSPKAIFYSTACRFFCLPTFTNYLGYGLTSTLMSTDSSGARSEFIDTPFELFGFGMRLTA